MTHKKTVLLVDDNPLLSNMYTTALHQNNFDVLVAHNGTEGLAMLKTQKPDIVMCDLMMPGVSGLEFLEHIQQDPELKETKCIILTNIDKSDYRARAQELGAIAYLIKSDVPVSEIAQVITQHCHDRETK